MSVRDIVHDWFRQRLASGAVARDTEAYNQVVAALPDLIAQLDPSDVAPIAPAALADAKPAEPPVPSEPPASDAEIHTA